MAVNNLFRKGLMNHEWFVALTFLKCRAIQHNEDAVTVLEEPNLSIPEKVPKS